jgi:hypothetical protein
MSLPRCRTAPRFGQPPRRGLTSGPSPAQPPRDPEFLGREIAERVDDPAVRRLSGYDRRPSRLREQQTAAAGAWTSPPPAPPSPPSTPPTCPDFRRVAHRRGVTRAGDDDRTVDAPSDVVTTARQEGRAAIAARV